MVRNLGVAKFYKGVNNNFTPNEKVIYYVYYFIVLYKVKLFSTVDVCVNRNIMSYLNVAITSIIKTNIKQISNQTYNQSCLQALQALIKIIK